MLSFACIFGVVRPAVLVADGSFTNAGETFWPWDWGELMRCIWSYDLSCAGVMANLKICYWWCQAADAKLPEAGPRILQDRRCLCWAEGQQVFDCRAQECLLEITATAPEAHPLQCLSPGRVPTCTCATLLVWSQAWNSAALCTYF